MISYRVIFDDSIFSCVEHIIKNMIEGRTKVIRDGDTLVEIGLEDYRFHNWSGGYATVEELRESIRFMLAANKEAES